MIYCHEALIDNKRQWPKMTTTTDRQAAGRPNAAACYSIIHDLGVHLFDDAASISTTPPLHRENDSLCRIETQTTSPQNCGNYLQLHFISPASHSIFALSCFVTSRERGVASFSVTSLCLWFSNFAFKSFVCTQVHTSSEYVGQVNISRSSGQGQGHRSKTVCLCILFTGGRP